MDPDYSVFSSFVFDGRNKAGIPTIELVIVSWRSIMLDMSEGPSSVGI